MDLEEEVLFMLELLQKRIYKKECHHWYRAHLLLCKSLETGQVYTLFYGARKD
jgi:hypothetical protein